MFDASALHSKLEAVIQSFADRAVALYVEELQRRAPAQTSSEAHRDASRPTAESRAGAAAPKVPSPVRSLRDRPNVIAFLAGKSPPAPPPTLVWSKSEGPMPKGPGPAEIADRAVAAVMSATEPLTLDQLRARVRVSKEALSPLVDEMIAARKITAVEVDGLTKYKRPRIEPIRRKKDPTP